MSRGLSTLSGNERMVSWMSARLAASSTSASVASILPYFMLYLNKGSMSRCLRHNQPSVTHLIVSLKSTVSCGTTPIACLRLAWLQLLMSSPPKVIFPFFTSNIRISNFATVVLPLPELKVFLSFHFKILSFPHLPTSAVVVPASILKDTFLEKNWLRFNSLCCIRQAYFSTGLQ